MRSIIIAIVLLSGIACKKQVEADEYYVKYMLNSTHYQIGGNLLVDVAKEDGSNLPSILVPIRQDWEITIGPVKKGFRARLTATKSGWNGTTAENHLRIYLQIHISKNDGPFALKELNGSDSPRATATTEHTIQ